MLRADHVVIPIFRPAESLHFYMDVLGLPLSDVIEGPDWGGRPWLMLVFGLEGGGEVVLVCRRGAPFPLADEAPKDLRHYAFSVADPAAQQAIEEKARKKDVELWREDHGERRSLYLVDPNGVVLEVTFPASATASVTDPEAHARALRWIGR